MGKTVFPHRQLRHREPIMPTLSARIQSLSPSPTVALNAKAKELKKAGADVLNFAVGEPDFLCPEVAIKTAVGALEAGDVKYGPAGGSPELRTAICEKLKAENGVSFSPDQVVCGIGAKEILFHIFLATLNEGDEVIINTPCWVSYEQQIKAAGGVPVFVPLGSSDNPIDVDEIEKYASEKTKAFVLCSPNNPAGYALNPEQLASLGKYLAKKDWWVISDEIYEYLSFDTPHQSIAAVVPELTDRYVHVNGLAKGYAMTGWRVGYTAAPVALSKLVKTLQSHSSTCIPPFIEKAALAAISAGKTVMEKHYESLKTRRDLAKSLLDEMADVDYINPNGAFYIYIDIRKALSKAENYDELDSMKFAANLLETKHVAVVPGEAFNSPGYLRFSYAASESDIKEGLSRLSTTLESL